jgi:hypothetical protein
MHILLPSHFRPQQADGRSREKGRVPRQRLPDPAFAPRTPKGGDHGCWQVSQALGLTAAGYAAPGSAAARKHAAELGAIAAAAALPNPGQRGEPSIARA